MKNNKPVQITKGDLTVTVLKSSVPSYERLGWSAVDNDQVVEETAQDDSQPSFPFDDDTVDVADE